MIVLIIRNIIKIQTFHFLKIIIGRLSKLIYFFDFDATSWCASWAEKIRHNESQSAQLDELLSTV
jgi:hypothetical protein